MDLLKSMMIFQEVINNKSFSKTAEQLNLVPSAISRQINELEKYFGCKLIHRTTRSLNLTEEGHYCLKKFSLLLAEVDNLNNELKNRSKNIKGRLKITTAIPMGTNYFQKLIAAFIKKYPQVELSWLVVNRHVNLIEEGFDLAIRAGFMPDSNLIMRQIEEFYLKFVASPHYLKLKGTPQTPKDLVNHLCLADTTIATSKRWKFFSKDKGEFYIPVKCHIEANNAETITAMAADGMGIAWLPDFYVNEYLKNDQLVEIFREYQTLPYPVSIIYPPDSKKSILIKTFIDFVLSEIENYKNPLGK